MSGEPLTEAERKALDLTRELANTMGIDVIGSLGRDWDEFAIHLHAIQHMIMAQAAARAYPDKYRLLGAGRDDAPPLPVAQQRTEINCTSAVTERSWAPNTRAPASPFGFTAPDA